MSKRVTRRRFLQYGAAGGAALFLPWARTPRATAAPGGQLTKYLEPVPLPGNGIVVASPSGANAYSFTQRQIARRLHPDLPPTPLWAYDDGSGLAGQAGSFGMAVVAQSGTPLEVGFTHDLPETYPSWLPVATRLNVFAGLAAAYIVRDQHDTGDEPNPIGIPGGAYEIPLVVQDRQFNPDGTFLYPTSDIAGVTWIGEYFGDVMLVNGKVWPFLEVEPRMYRFRILNGCNARILGLDIGGPSLWQIGAEGGMWDKPVSVKQLVLAPAERADVLIDFSKFAGQTLVMKNHKPPKPVSNPAPQLEQVMQIRVGTTVSQPGPTSIPPSLPGRAADVVGDVVATRYITLNEIDVDEPTWFLNLNGVHFDEGPVTETPRVGTVEDWVYVNVTGDTHPMHTHLVTFQVVGRTPFDAEAYEEANEGAHGVPGGIDPTPFATGPMEPPDPSERGYKDTVKANPSQFTTIRAKFDLPTGVTAPQSYVHHCHIVEHEDNDMMRPFEVVA
jgi:spore coat protein A